MTDVDEILSSAVTRELRLSRIIQNRIFSKKKFLYLSFYMALFALVPTVIWLLWDQNDEGISRTPYSGWIGIFIYGAFCFLLIRNLWIERRNAFNFASQGEALEGQIVPKAPKNHARNVFMKLFMLFTTQEIVLESWQRIRFTSRFGTHFVYCPFDLTQQDEAPLWVLFRPKYKYALVFDHKGSAMPVRVRKN